MLEKNFYTVWSWNEAPYAIRIASPLEEGTWIVRVEPGYGFPHSELNVSEHPEWEVEVSQIEGRWYTFIKDPENRYWPRLDPELFFHGPAYDNSPFSQSYEVP